VRIVGVPSAPFVALERIAGGFGRTLPAIGEFARMAEDKRIDIGRMRETLGVDPISVEEGLARKAARGWLQESADR
jgi:nucleoside-diphosphate-sugar epimerase